MMSSPPRMPSSKPQAFMIADSGARPRTIGIVADRTVERMTLEGAAVFRYAISKHMLMMSSEDDRPLPARARMAAASAAG
jgi:hypothetical protein